MNRPPDPSQADPAAAYERLGALYDAWCATVLDDLPRWVLACRGTTTHVVELGCGSGRVVVEVAGAGHDVVGVDRSPAMLALARERAERLGVSERVRLVEGDLRAPPPVGPSDRVLAPFRPFMHLMGDEERLAALRGAHDLLTPGGQLVFDVFEPHVEDVRQTHGRWIEREPGIRERARWDSVERRILLEVEARGVHVAMQLEWLEPGEWRALAERAGLRVLAIEDGYSGRPWHSGPGDHVLVCERPV